MAMEMQIFVKTLGGRNMIIDALPSITVAQLKGKIYEKDGTPPDQQKLAYIGNTLEDSKTLQSYNIVGGATIHLVVTETSRGETMAIFVKTLTGRTISINLNSSCTVAEAKEMIRQKEGIPANQQQLIFSGRTLENSRSLNSYNIQRNSTVHLVIKVSTEQADPSALATSGSGAHATAGHVQRGHLPSPVGVAGSSRIRSAEVSKRSAELLLTINTPSGRDLKFNVHSDESVLGLKELISRKDGVHPDNLVLTCAGSQLQNGRRLCDYGITFNCTIQLSYPPNSHMNMYVKTLSGQTFFLTPSIYQTIGDIKQELNSKQNIDTSQQLLVYQGKPLEEDRLLLDCHLPSQCTVHIIQDQQTHAAPPPLPGRPVSKQQSMPILFRTLKGDMITLLIQPTDRVEEVKRRLQDREGIPRDQMSLLLGGTELRDEALMSEYRLQQDSTLLVTFKPSNVLQLNVLDMTSNRLATVRDLTETETVNSLVDKALRALNIGMVPAVLVCNGKVLNPTSTLGQCSLHNSGVVQVFTERPAQLSVSVATVASVCCECEVYSNETVSALKSVIHKKMAVPPAQQVLIKRGQVLSDTVLLSDVFTSRDDSNRVCLSLRVGVRRTLSVSLPNGQTMSFVMESHQTVLDLKTNIAKSAAAVPILKQSLHYRGSTLEDQYCIGDYLFPDGALLSLCPLQSQDLCKFFVKSESIPKMSVFTIDAQSPLSLLKLLIAQELCIPYDKLKLFFCGDLLFNEKPVVQYGFPNPCTLWADY